MNNVEIVIVDARVNNVCGIAEYNPELDNFENICIYDIKLAELIGICDESFYDSSVEFSDWVTLNFPSFGLKVRAMNTKQFSSEAPSLNNHYRLLFSKNWGRMESGQISERGIG